MVSKVPSVSSVDAGGGRSDGGGGGGVEGDAGTSELLSTSSEGGSSCCILVGDFVGDPILKSVPDDLSRAREGGLTSALFGLPCVGWTSLGPFGGSDSALDSISCRFGGGAVGSSGDCG